jgi:hypothetical protein
VAGKLDAFFAIPRPVQRFPESLDDVEQWCKTELGEKLALHPRALDGAKKSLFCDIPLVYRCLRLLGNEYYANRLAGGSKTRNKLNGALGQLGVTISKSISLAVAKQQGDDYFIHYPLEEGPNAKEFLNLHLKKGVDHDERTCLRIYFFWDDLKKAVVVGWMTSHLGTKRS